MLDIFLFHKTYNFWLLNLKFLYKFLYIFIKNLYMRVKCNLTYTAKWSFLLVLLNRHELLCYYSRTISI